MKEKEVQPHPQNSNTDTSIMSEQGSYDGSDLIVDFGEQRQPSEVCGEVPASMNVVVHCFQYLSRDEVSARWYGTLRMISPSSGKN